MGVFNTCAFVGGISANFLSVWILSSIGWRFVFPISSIFVAIMGVAVFFSCHENPVTIMSVQTESQSTKVEESEEPLISDPSDPSTLSSPPPANLSWRDLVSKPGFPQICVCMFCLKVTRYFVYMWLPYLYTKEFDYSEASAGTASSGFEMGGVFGSMLIGLLVQ